MLEKTDDREGKDFFSWFIFQYDDVASLFQDARLSADRMKGFVEAVPEEVRRNLRKIAPFLETWVLMKGV